MNKLVVGKLVPVPVNLSKLGDLVKNYVVKKRCILCLDKKYWI